MDNYLFEVKLKKKKAASKSKTRKKPIKFVTQEEHIDLTNGRILLILPIETVSEGNCFEPWQKRYARHKIQKKIIWLSMLKIKYEISLPCIITFCRLAPRTLDAHDNLPMSLKYIVDAVASEITGDYRPGFSDNNKQISWKYSQEKSSAYGVKIDFSWKKSNS